jgi:hypothetical protein
MRAGNSELTVPEVFLAAHALAGVKASPQKCASIARSIDDATQGEDPAVVLTAVAFWLMAKLEIPATRASFGDADA